MWMVHESSLSAAVVKDMQVLQTVYGRADGHLVTVWACIPPLVPALLVALRCSFKSQF